MPEVTSILEKLRHFASATPDKVCIIEGLTGKKITYGEFWQGILRYASCVKQGTKYILQTRQTIEHLIAFYGIQAAGSVAIPVEATATKERLEDLALQFDAIILPVEYTLSDTPAAYCAPNIENIACVICTSGTTGKTKGVLSSFRCRFCGADNVRYTYEITPSDIALIPQVLSHSGGLRRVEAMLVSGATAVIMSSAMMFGDIFGAIKKYRCNILQFVPAQVSQILFKAQRLLESVAGQLRIVSVGSAVITEGDKEKLRELLPSVRLFNDFGSTEAVGSAYFEWSKYPPKPGCVGVASLHSKIVFLSDDGKVTKTSKECPAILATEGGTLMSGYLNERELSAKVLQNSRVISSDLGYMGSDGMIYILGRKDDIIVSGANKIAPAEIETAVQQIRGVKECACVPKKDRVMGQMPALFIVWEGQPLPVDELLNILDKKLEHFKVPKAEDVYTIESLPRTPGTGKVIKHELVERLG